MKMSEIVKMASELIPESKTEARQSLVRDPVMWERRARDAWERVKHHGGPQDELSGVVARQLAGFAVLLHCRAERKPK